MTDMAGKIGQIVKTAAFVLCVMMLLECASAGFVWADTENEEDIKADTMQVELQEPEASSDELSEEIADMDDEAGSDLQAEPGDNTGESGEPEPLNGWIETDGGRMYYVDGIAQTGMLEIDGAKYYFDDSGIMQTGMQSIGGKKYYFDENGVMQTGFADISGKRYCFGDDGVMKTGMSEYGGSWYYFSGKGVMKTGWKTISKKKYYFDPGTGKRQSGKKTISGAVYYFSKSGVMKTGWLKVSGKKYYHDPDSGKRIFGAKKIGKYYYYFKGKNGVMKTGWLKLKGKTYYYDSKGRKRFGEIKVNGKTYYLHLKTGARMSKGSYYLYKPVWNKSSRTKYLVYVNKKSRYVTVYKGSIRNWTVVKRFRCSIGKPSTPTPSGTYRMSSKVLHFGESKGYSVWYASGFIGTTYLMHSVVCYRGTKRVSDGRLGQAISHGCVRMAMGNAKWIYNNVPRGTTVYIK